MRVRIKLTELLYKNTLHEDCFERSPYSESAYSNL